MNTHDQDPIEEHLLQRLFASPATEPDGPFPDATDMTYPTNPSHFTDDPESVYRWSYGLLDPETAELFSRHLAACSYCRDEIAELVALGILDCEEEETDENVEKNAAADPGEASVESEMIVPFTPPAASRESEPDGKKGQETEDPPRQGNRNGYSKKIWFSCGSIAVLLLIGVSLFLVRGWVPDSLPNDAVAIECDPPTLLTGIRTEAVWLLTHYERPVLTKGMSLEQRVESPEHSAHGTVSFKALPEKRETENGKAERNDAEINAAAKSDRRRREIESLLADRPDQAYLQLEYGELFLAARNFDEAAKVFENILRKSPNDPYSFLGLGIAEYERNRYENAFEFFETAIRMGADNPLVRLFGHMNAALCCDRLGCLDDEEHWQAALDASKDESICDLPVVLKAVPRIRNELRRIESLNNL